jgi:hypothetical protein
MFVTGRYAEEILDFLRDRAPKMSVVTNTLDLVSLIFLTPKCFSGDARGHLHQLFREIANTALGNGIVKWDSKHVTVAGAALFIILSPLLYIISSFTLRMGPQFLQTMDSLQCTFQAKGVDVD